MPTLIESPVSWHKIWREIHKIGGLDRDVGDTVFGILARLSFNHFPHPTLVRGGSDVVHVIWRLSRVTLKLTVLPHTYGLSALHRVARYNDRPRRYDYEGDDCVAALFYHVTHAELARL